MRFFEILILISLLLGVVFASSLNHTNRWSFLPKVLPLGLVLIQLLVEGYRWQMAPAYLLALVVLLTILRKPQESGQGLKRWFRSTLGAAGVLVVILTALLAWGFPVITTPQLTGPYQVGTSTHQWVDETRAEPYTDDRDDRRTLMVQFWYPANPGNESTPAPYITNEDIILPILADKMGWPAFMLDYMSLVKTRSFTDAPIAKEQEKFPVLIYSHGLGGNRTEAFARMEALASQGYIVAAIDHTYGSDVTVFSDGRVTRFVNLRSWDDSVARVDSIRTGRATVWAADVGFVIDQMEQIQTETDSSPWAGRVDLGRIGAFGFSNGGTTAVLASWADSRIKASINLDGTPRGPVVQSGLDRPVLFVRRTPEEYSNEQLTSWGFTRETFYLKDIRMKAMVDQMGDDGYLLTIDGMKHGDFTDRPLISPVAHKFGIGGPLGRKSIDIVNDYVQAFFDKYLKDKSGTLLDANVSSYSEAKLVGGA